VIHLRLGDGLYSTFGENEGKGVFPLMLHILIFSDRQRKKKVLSVQSEF
jgi:hypothetical protein